MIYIFFFLSTAVMVVKSFYQLKAPANFINA